MTSAPYYFRRLRDSPDSELAGSSVCRRRDGRAAPRPNRRAVRGDRLDAVAAHLAEVQPAGDDIAVGGVLGLDVLRDETAARRDSANDLDVDRSAGDRAQLGAERLARPFELEAPQRGEQ